MRTLIVIGFIAAKMWGCSCAISISGTPPCQSAWSYDAVFTGTVTQITDPGRLVISHGLPTMPTTFPQKKIEFKITEALTGLNSKQEEIVIETGLGGGDCGYSFRLGYEYIVYASRRPDGSYFTGICTPTRPIDLATEDLRYFHQLAKASTKSEIRVIAYNFSAPRVPALGGRSEIPTLPGVLVTVDGGGVHQSAITDEAGRYVFSGLPPGEYGIGATLDGFGRPENQRPVKVHAKGCAQFDLSLRLDRTLSGRVLSSEGLPVEGVNVESVPFRPRFENELPWANDSAVTDSKGNYKLRNFSTEDYYIGISLSRSPSLENPYTRWFYPGTEDPRRAVILHVTDGPEAQTFDFMLPAAQHGRTIEGRVFWPDSRPAEGVSILLEDPRWPWLVSNVATVTDKVGHFVTQALDGTSYRIHASIFANGPISSDPVSINAGSPAPNLSLVLTRKGYSPIGQSSAALDGWRKGFGLR